MTFKQGFMLALIGALALGYLGLEMINKTVNQFDAQQDELAAIRKAACEQAVDRCNPHLLISRADAANATALYLYDRLPQHNTPRDHAIIRLWGIEAAAVSTLHAKATINDFVMEHGPWVACWERHVKAHTCFALGNKPPETMPYYRPETDIALHLLKSGYATFSPGGANEPLTPIAYDPDAQGSRVSSLYLSADGKVGVRP